MLHHSSVIKHEGSACLYVHVHIAWQLLCSESSCKVKQIVTCVGLTLGLGCCSYVGTEDGKPFVFVSSIWDDQPKPLAAGDELFISYMASTPPLTAFLNLGFVPEELLTP